MQRLQIGNPRERALVSIADRLLGVLFRAARRVVERPGPDRVLLLRLERIGDLVMSLPAIRDVRALAPQAEIDLVVGEWNEQLARAIPYVNRVEILSPVWLARESGAGLGLFTLLRRAWHWRSRHYDLGVNFEPDIRTNLLLGLSGARWKAGWTSAGGGALLDTGLDYDPGQHTTANSRRLIATAFARQAPPVNGPLLSVSPSAARAAESVLPRSRAPLVAVHVSGGRAVKQWDPLRFSDVACQLASHYGAVIVLTGSTSDKPLVDVVKSALPTSNVVDLAGTLDLVTLAAVLERADLVITGDTGPMHLAHAVGTPVVAIFGPSKPDRYGPAGPADRIVRIDLPCSPCNRIRNPPARCVGHTPDCLTGVTVAQVVRAACEVLSLRAESRGTAASG